MNVHSLKEAVSDTILGTLINFPLNFVLVYIGLYYEMTALELTTFMTVVMFIAAVVRKYFVRNWFDKRTVKEI